MGFPINGDLIPSSSGFANLGVGVDSNAQDAFDADNIRPFNHIHQVSGIFHDPLLGQSGVLRFNQAAGAFEVSVDGGKTFAALSAGGGVTSIGVIGGANLTGAVDLASQASGFIAITDNGGSSPIYIAVNHLGLSGLWNFPPQGFGGSLVNALTDSNSTSAQGIINVVGASGLYVDIVGQTLTITPGNLLPRGYSNTFSATPSATITHNLNSLKVIVQVYDSSTPRLQLIPDRISVTDANTVTLRFNTNQNGLVTVLAID